MDYSDIDYGAYDRLERSLIDPNTLLSNEQTTISQERRVFQNRRFIQQALSQEKRNRKRALSMVQETERRIVEIDRKRRGHLLQGIKLRNKLEKLSEVQQVSTILLMEREIRRRKEQQQQYKKKQQYVHQRNSSEDRQEITSRIYNERRLRLMLKNKQEEHQLEQEKKRLQEAAFEQQRNRVEKTRQDHARQKNRMKRYEAFKSARAMDNYNDKVLKLLEEQKVQQDTMRALFSRESEQKEIMKKTQKLGQSSNMLERLLEGRTFQLTTL